MHESDHLGVATRHADPKPLVQSLEPGQNHSARKNLKGEKTSSQNEPSGEFSCLASLASDPTLL